MPGDPADKGGVRADDVIVGIDGARLETTRDLQRVVSSTPVGKKCAWCSCARGGRPRSR